MSTYDRDLIQDWYGYVVTCLDAPQVFKDSGWSARQSDHQNLWDNILMAEAKGAGHSEWDIAFCKDFRREEVNSGDRAENDNGNDTDDDDDLRESAEEDEQTSCLPYVFGFHQSFADYHVHCIEQQQIDRSAIATPLFRRVFSKLKTLKSIVFSDWRTLAKCSESYSDCARRLCGNTLAPGLMNPANSHKSFELLHELVEAINTSKSTSIECLYIGSHPFEDSTLPLMRSVDPRGPMYMPLVDVNVLFTVAHRLRSLHLQLDTASQISRPASCSAPNLEHLALSIRLPEKASSATLDKLLLVELHQLFFADIRYSRLKILDLRGWVLLQSSVETVLAKNASTIRSIHLTNCHLTGDPKGLALWAGRNLSLHGVEIRLIPELALSESQTLADVTNKMHTVTALRPEEESVWLADTHNAIVRIPIFTLLMDDGSQHEHWWEMKSRMQ